MYMLKLTHPVDSGSETENVKSENMFSTSVSSILILAVSQFDSTEL